MYVCRIEMRSSVQTCTCEWPEEGDDGSGREGGRDLLCSQGSCSCLHCAQVVMLMAVLQNSIAEENQQLSSVHSQLFSKLFQLFLKPGSHAHTHTHIQTHTHMRTHAHAHTHTHTHTLLWTALCQVMRDVV